ncbi:MAG: tRNA (adenosine(37)-N6)-threonylcarbamoyltransferase complex transferase subunit TsaD [Candidatus Marsarchaeota archaeon]|jgi:glycoprotease/Kae1 family metallohydrolase|nr:tRNA (adenosine(37)-N6)-threonylcarbamoyltransferase complex transferase subunit TsaD [Candidatus Marsarchaeota archaeon]
MAVLGIESSAHTFGVGIVERGKILANEKSMYRITNKGMIPAEVAEFHIANATDVVERALDASGLRIDGITGIGYTRGPGLGPCLQVGQLTAKSLALRLDVPIVPVNHGLAHVEITKHIARLKDPLALYVSGGNSQILKFDRKMHRYSVLGETFDIGIGNMLDALGRSLGLKHAWGSEIERLALHGRYIPLPYTVKGMDFAFAGLLTKASRLAGREKNEDLCYSVQETSFAMLCEAAERALLLSESSELCVCGGVAQNARLAGMLGAMAREHGARFARAPDEYNSDNGAMIALVAEKMISKGMAVPLGRCGIEQRYRIDRAVL